MLEPGLSLPMLVCKHMDQNRPAVMLAAKRPGVTPEVNMKNPLYTGNAVRKSGNPPRL